MNAVIKSSIRATFNSLSRDHIPKEPGVSKRIVDILSTPSLGITGCRSSTVLRPTGSPFNSLSRDHVIRPRHVIIAKTFRAFNSLSRDHRSGRKCSSGVVDSRNFQLPLSGSLSLDSGSSRARRLLFQLPLSGSPSIISFAHEQGKYLLLSTPSLGITGAPAAAAAGAVSLIFQLPLSGSPSLLGRKSSQGFRLSFQLPLSGSPR